MLIEEPRKNPAVWNGERKNISNSNKIFKEFNKFDCILYVQYMAGNEWMGACVLNTHCTSDSMRKSKLIGIFNEENTICNFQTSAGWSFLGVAVATFIYRNFFFMFCYSYYSCRINWYLSWFFGMQCTFLFWNLCLWIKNHNFLLNKRRSKNHMII